MEEGPQSMEMVGKELAVPDFARIPKVLGRILLGGEILTSGFNKKEVTAFFPVSDASGNLVKPVLGETSDVDADIFSRAIDAAHLAWGHGRGVWPTTAMQNRIDAMRKFRKTMTEKREQLAAFLMWEIGKSWTDSLNEVDRTLTYIDETVEAAKQLDRDSSRIHYAAEIMAQIHRMPLGVTLCIGPFNYPLNETFTTLIPAIIMGNTVVVKCPRYGQLFWDLLLDGFADSFPAGVVNVVNGVGRNIVTPSVEVGKIDVLALIGSSTTANKIKAAHPRPSSFRAILGLDAKNPAIILPDADLQVAVKECLKGALSFNGQRCTALKIIFVPRDLQDAFVASFVEQVAALKAGLPWESGVNMTPLPDPEKPAELRRLIEDAVARGAKIAYQKQAASLANLLHPTVLSHVPIQAKIAHVEQFGPLVPIVPYQDPNEVKEYLTHSPFGMQASLFGREPSELGQWIDFLQNMVCRINLNVQCQRGPDIFPFTGRRQSAEGTLSISDALRCFSIRTMVATKQDASGKQIFEGIIKGGHSDLLSVGVVF